MLRDDGWLIQTPRRACATYRGPDDRESRMLRPGRIDSRLLHNRLTRAGCPQIGRRATSLWPESLTVLHVMSAISVREPAVRSADGAVRLVDALAELSEEQDLVASRAQLLRLMSEEQLRWKISSARWQVPFPGVIVMHSGPLSPAQQLWVDLLCCGKGAVLAGLTAAIEDGLTGLQPIRPQILVPHRRQVTDRDDLDVHSSTRLGTADVHPLKRPRRTKTPRSLVDAASWAKNDGQARTILAAGVQQRLTRATDMLEIVDAVPNLRRRKVIRLTLHDIGGGAHSLPELDFAQLCRTFDLPSPSRQVVRRDSSGRRRWLDVYWDVFGLAVEIDGLFHMEASQWWSDMWRGNEHAIRLEGVLRYPSFAIRDEPERVAAQISEALRARGWSGPT